MSTVKEKLDELRELRFNRYEINAHDSPLNFVTVCEAVAVLDESSRSRGECISRAFVACFGKATQTDLGNENKPSPSEAEGEK